MPTPVSSARQCLTTEAAFALDEAVSVARRRAHAQTMSLHAIYALFSLPNSSLREACGHVRNSAYSSRLQFKALELSLSVSLDRVPSARPQVEDPPVSNSLMAAIRRSQANQKRHPENYHMYYQIQLQQHSGSAVSCIKVELQHLILAMLDDPIVSRVFGEAGFRSCDIKMAVMRLHPCFIGYSRHIDSSLFLSNLHKDASLRVGNFGYQFPASTGILDEDLNHKRICEILVKKKGRNPLLVGVCAYNAIKSFIGSLAQKSQISLPMELSGIIALSIDKEVSKFVSKNPSDSEKLKIRLEGIEEMVNETTAGRLIVDIGDLHCLLAEDPEVDSLNNIILQVKEMLAAHKGKLWLIGSVVNYEMYLKFVAKFPSIENDWDLQLLPISALRPAAGVNTYSRSSSKLMESFIPFGGFFSTSDIKCSQSHMSVKDISTRGLVSSGTSQYIPSLPSWLADLRRNSGEQPFKKKSDRVAGKSLGAYECLHQVQPPDELEISKFGSQDEIKTAEQGTGNINHSSDPSKGSLLSKLLEKPSQSQHLDSSSFKSPVSTRLIPGKFDEQCLSTSAKTLVTTTLGLSIVPSPTPETDVHLVSMSNITMPATIHSTQQSSSSGSTSSEQHSYEKFKMIFRCLSQRFPHQREAIGLVCKTLVYSRSASPRGDIWMAFLGPQSHCKKSVAAAMAELYWGEHGNIVYVDLNECQNRFRGKTSVDYIADALNKKPFSVVFLKDVEKADLLLRSTLYKAVRTGKFSDSHGRDVCISNAIFIAASDSISKNKQPIPLESINSTEMRIIKVKSSAFRMLHCHISPRVGTVVAEQTQTCKRKLADSEVAAHNVLEISGVTKRVLKQSSDTQFDLNMPANFDDDTDDSYHCQSTQMWLEDFVDLIDETVEFNSFDFDGLALKLSKQMADDLHDIVGSEHMLQIDTDVMDQILAVAYISECPNIVDDWIRLVLIKHFTEAQVMYDFGSPSVVKLVACNQILTVDVAPHLPPSISFS